MEHIVASTCSLSKHLESNKILYDLKHGFREMRFFDTQFIQLVEELARNTSQGRQNDLILLDFIKAFDRVNHQNFLFKLHQHGVRGHTLSRIKAFLIGRSQKLDGESSSEIPVHWNPSRICTWPIIISTIHQRPTWEHAFTIPYTAVYLSVNNEADSNLTAARPWHLTNMGTPMVYGLWSKYLHIIKSRHPALHIYTLHGEAPEAIDHARYLGVDISKYLSWNTKSTGYRTLGFVKRKTKTKRTHSRTAAYTTIVRPQVHIEYVSPVWIPYTQASINTIETGQRRVARWVSNNYSSYAKHKCNSI